MYNSQIILEAQTERIKRKKKEFTLQNEACTAITKARLTSKRIQFLDGGINMCICTMTLQ